VNRTIAYCVKCKTGIQVAWVVSEADIDAMRGNCANCMSQLNFLPVHTVEMLPPKPMRVGKWNYKLTPEQRLDIIERYAAGEKVEAIGELYGVRGATVVKMARSAGVPPRRVQAWRATSAS
jgi:hypothetical protein